MNKRDRMLLVHITITLFALSLGAFVLLGGDVWYFILGALLEASIGLALYIMGDNHGKRNR